MDLDNNEVGFTEVNDVDTISEEKVNEASDVTNVTEKNGKTVVKKDKPGKIDNLSKLKASSITALSILKVLSIICGIFAGIFLIGGIILICKNPDIIQSLSKFATLQRKVQSIIDGNSLLKNFSKDGYTGMTFGIYSTAYGAYLLVLLVLMRLMAKVFRNFAVEATPFNKRTIRTLKGVFWVITISALSLNVFFGIFTGFVLWCVIKIFRYGVELQEAGSNA